MSAVGRGQWQLSLNPSLQVSDFAIIRNPPFWTGVFAIVRVPRGNYKRNLGHSFWVHVYTSNNFFYQVGFEEAGRGPPEANETFWRAFWATTRVLVNPDDTNSVDSQQQFDDGKELIAEKGKEYLLYIELGDGTIDMGIWDGDTGRMLVSKKFTEASPVLRGGNAAPQCSFTLEAIEQYEDADYGDIEDFIVRSLAIQHDEATGIDYPVTKVRVEVFINYPPAFLGVKRIDDYRLLIGQGYPLPRGLSAEI